MGSMRCGRLGDERLLCGRSERAGDVACIGSGQGPFWATTSSSSSTRSSPVGTAVRSSGDLGEIEPLPVLGGNQVEVGCRVLGDDLAHVGAERQNGKAAAAGVIECFGDQLLAQSSPAEVLVHFGVGEGDPLTGELVDRETGQLCVVVDLVSALGWVV